jgi:hypothetical protein
MPFRTNPKNEEFCNKPDFELCKVCLLLASVATAVTDAYSERAVEGCKFHTASSLLL